MRIISILDTTICDYNLGNQIIMESVYKILDELFPDAFIFKLQYGEKFGKLSLNYIRKSDFTFFGGTNSLSSQMNKYSQMGFRFSDLIFVKNKLILLGVGWWQYQKKTNLYTRIFLKNLLREDIFHSVRDSYSKKMLNSIGINNVINTSCPTTWCLTPEHCQKIPTKKSENVIITITDYNFQYESEKKLIETIFPYYKKVFFWLQGVGDLKLINSLEDIIKKHKDKFYIIPPKLKEYDNILKNEDIDYIGTRLHAGIRALQFGKRTLIVEIDNRAKEISKDINLPTINRGNIDSLMKFITDGFKIDIKIPEININKWKSQFK